MPAHVHPLRTFGDLADYHPEAVVSCRCGRHGTIDAAADFFRNRPIGSSRFRCTAVLPNWGGQQCSERHAPEIRELGRDGCDLPDHWRAMIRRNPAAARPDRLRTFRDQKAIYSSQVTSARGRWTNLYKAHLTSSSSANESCTA